MIGLIVLASMTAFSPRPEFREAPGSPFKVGSQAGRLVTGDVNGDGFLDIVLACGACCGQKPAADAGHVAVLLNDGRGSFRLAADPIKIGPTALRVALADFNRDGALDIACIEHGTYDVHILLGDGKGGFSRKPGRLVSREGTRPHSHDIVAADLNGDGAADLAVTNADDNTVSVVLNDGSGGFRPASGSPFGAGRHPYEGLTAGDLTGDGVPDLAVTNLMGRAVAVLRNDGKGSFSMAPGFPVGVGERPGFLAAGDVNGDGRADLLVSHDDVGLVHVLVADAEFRYRSAGAPCRQDEPVWGLAVADMDGDGVGDAVLAGPRGNIHVLRSDGQGGLGPRRVTLKAGQDPCYVVAADFNKDGKPDLASSNYKSGDVTVWLGK